MRRVWIRSTICAVLMFSQQMETILLHGRLTRVYKHLFPSLRSLWLWAVNEHKEKPYIVYEGETFTFQHIFNESLKAAAAFRDVYGIRKGDRYVWPLPSGLGTSIHFVVELASARATIRPT